MWFNLPNSPRLYCVHSVKSNSSAGSALCSPAAARRAPQLQPSAESIQSTQPAPRPAAVAVVAVRFPLWEALWWAPRRCRHCVRHVPHSWPNINQFFRDMWDRLTTWQQTLNIWMLTKFDQYHVSKSTEAPKLWQNSQKPPGPPGLRILLGLCSFRLELGVQRGHDRHDRFGHFRRRRSVDVGCWQLSFHMFHLHLHRLHQSIRSWSLKKIGTNGKNQLWIGIAIHIVLHQHPQTGHQLAGRQSGPSAKSLTWKAFVHPRGRCCSTDTCRLQTYINYTYVYVCIYSIPYVFKMWLKIYTHVRF